MGCTTLIVGASGFIGRNLAPALKASGHSVRCLTRNPARSAGLFGAEYDVVQGDMLDAESVGRAATGVGAVYLSVQTLTRRQPLLQRGDFMDAERRGLDNVIAACRRHSVRRVVYITTLGIEPDSDHAWMRGRWEVEEQLLRSGLDATVIQPGQVLGFGGGGFDNTVRQSRSRVVFLPGTGRQRYRNIALGDLVYYLVGILEEPRAHGQRYQVGCDDVVSYEQMIDICAEEQGRPHPAKVRVPLHILRGLAPILWWLLRLPPGAGLAGVQSFEGDLIGDPMPIRELLPRPPLGYREGVRQALRNAERA